MPIDKAHCMFEQSGTFKKEFIRLGIPAEDYDIQDEFGETDNVVDLFAEIDKAYEGKESIFDRIGKDDVVFAFYPCTRFEAYNPSNFQGKNPGYKNWSLETVIQNSMALHNELNEMYARLCKLFCICLRGGVENDCRESLYTASLPHHVLPGETKSDR